MYKTKAGLCLVLIRKSREVNASMDLIWSVISEVDNDSEYWKGLSSIHNIRKEDNLIEREVKVGFMGSRGRQTIKLNPKESIVLTMSKGPLKGFRIINLIPLDGGKKTKIDVSWDFEFSGVPIFARAFVKAQIEEGTKEALERIANAAEVLHRSS